MSWLGSPNVDEVVFGKHTLNLYGLQNSAAAAPVSVTQLRGIQEVTFDPNISTEDIFQQGGGDDALKYATNVEWNGQLTILGGLLSQQATLLGLTMGAAGQYGIPLRSNHESIGYIERKIYKKDNVTLIGSQIIPDIKFGDINLPGPIEQAQMTIPIYSERSPMLLVDAVAVYDTFDGNGTLTAFTPSSTPVKIQADLLAPSNELVTIYDFWVKVWASGDREGTRQMSGYTITPATPVLTFDTAPVAGTLIGLLYAKATS